MYEVRSTTVAPSGAYVRSTMYDVRFEEFPRLRASVAPGGAYVQCTIWIIARVARRGVWTQRGCVAPQGRTADGAAVSQFEEFPRRAVRDACCHDL